MHRRVHTNSALKLHCFLWGAWASVDFNIYMVPEANSLEVTKSNLVINALTNSHWVHFPSVFPSTNRLICVSSGTWILGEIGLGARETSHQFQEYLFAQSWEPEFGFQHLPTKLDIPHRSVIPPPIMTETEKILGFDGFWSKQENMSLNMCTLTHMHMLTQIHIHTKYKQNKNLIHCSQHYAC